MSIKKILHLVVTFHWYDESAAGRKSIEYRAMVPRWRRIIWDRRHEYTHLRLARAYTSTMAIYEIEKIDIGDCPLDGWDDEQYYRIHYK